MFYNHRVKNAVEMASLNPDKKLNLNDKKEVLKKGKMLI